MAGPLIATKLYVPKVRRTAVARPRLLDRLRGAADCRLILLSASAGFGKTTLLSEWFDDEARRGSGRVAWVSLDRADNEPARFWTYVVTALRGAMPAVGSSALDLMSSSPIPTDLMLVTLLNELTAASQDVWLVLDDYHLVDDHDIGHGMRFLLEHVPPHVHIVLSTRADPDLPLARWRVRGELVEIRAADLRFTSDEVTAYLRGVTGRDLLAKDLEVLEARTEGWIAALQLAALSIRGREDPSSFIAQFAGDDRYVVDYLVEEVLAHQPPEVRDFLQQSAVLDRLTGPLCDAVADTRDSTRMLLDLERANLFLVALDDRRQWYRYHHLFADVLRARLLAQQPELVAVLHQRASRWFEANDAPEEAVGHAMAGRDFGRAAYLMEMAVPAMRRTRQDATMLRWLIALPDDVVRGSPVLSVVYGYMLMVAGDLTGVASRLDDADRALATGPDASSHWARTDELRTLPATIEIHRASLAQARGDLAGTSEHARRALVLAGPDDHLSRGAGAAFLGLVAWSRGDVPGALETFAGAIGSLHAAGNVVDELSSTVVLADMWLAAGRPATARRLCLGALQASQALGGAALRAAPDLLVALSELDYEAGDLESAKDRLETAAALGEGVAMTEGLFRWFVARARLAGAEGDPDEAVALFDQAERRYLPGFFPDLRPVAAMRARAGIRAGHLPQAWGWAAEHRVTVADDADPLREFDHLTLARLVLAQHRTHVDAGGVEQVVALLDRLHVAARTSGRIGSVVEIGMLQAMAHDARGRRGQALEVLAQALTAAPEPDGYARLFLDEGAPMVELLRDAHQHHAGGHHPGRLLGLGPGRDTPSSDRARSLPAPAGGELSERELQVLRLLDSDLSGPQIARQLFVSHNTISTHTKHIFAKLDVNSRRAAVSRARERGLM